MNKVSQFLQTPLTTHWEAVKRILRYLRGTLSDGLLLKAAHTLQLIAFSDVDWVADMDDRKSVSGYCVLLGQTPISWSSKKQENIFRSSCEAKCRSLAFATLDVMWVCFLFAELCIPLKEPDLIWCGNQSAIALASNPVLHTRIKHVELDFYFGQSK